MLCAWLNDDDSYRVASYRHKKSDTYHAKERLRKHGATWNGKHWIVTNEQREALGIPRIFWVIAPTCHEENHVTFCLETQAEVNKSIRTFCAHCDSECFSKIRKVFGEEHPLRKDNV